ncbi:MAG: SPOR domain-containing protein [Planctomycetota bacterium]
MTRRGREIVLVVALGLIAGLPGCAQPRSGGTADSVALYEMGRPGEALVAARSEHRGATGRARERAALTAGLSAHSLGRDTEAEGWLRPLRSSRDDRVSGRAVATLGLIAMDRGEHARAAGLLERAGRELTGEAGARAQFHAAENFALAGNPETARLHMRLALARTGDPELRDTIRAGLGIAGYTLQVGAFAERGNAVRAQDRVRASAARLGLGEPMIVEKASATGARLYVVRVGAFSDARSAREARVRLGNTGVVTPVNP